MNKMIKTPTGALEVIQAIQHHGFEANLVGGCVRDSLLGHTPNDWDINTNALPEQLIEIFKDYRVIPTGLKHGTITVMVDKEAYEVTTYRTDGTYSDGRRPDSVTFVTSLKEDLARRDFTINAMAYDPTSDILFDPFNGHSDIVTGMIKAVREAEDRITEDYLRMLRAVRYATRFGYCLDGALEAAIKKHASKIHGISSERIFQEIYKMASQTGQNFACSLRYLKHLGLLKEILPEIDCMDQFPHAPETHPEGGVWEHVLACLVRSIKSDPALNLAILFHDVGKPLTYTNTDKIRYLMHHEVGLGAIEEICNRLRVSNDLKETWLFVCKWHMLFHTLLEVSDYKLTQLILDKNWDILYSASLCDDASRGAKLFDLTRWVKIDLRVKSLKERAAEKAKFDAIRSFVNGDLVMQLRSELRPGREIGTIIHRTLEYIINNNLSVTEHAKEIYTFIQACET